MRTSRPSWSCATTHGDEGRRTHHINIANWIPDLFMQRVEQNGQLVAVRSQGRAGAAGPVRRRLSTVAVPAGRGQGLAKKTLPARDLYARMMRVLAQTGNGWMTFKDKSNRACNQTGQSGQTVHLSNLCTEILEVTHGGETAVVQPGLDQPLAPPRPGRLRFRAAGAHGGSWRSASSIA